MTLFMPRLFETKKLKLKLKPIATGKVKDENTVFESIGNQFNLGKKYKQNNPCYLQEFLAATST